jgi:hypothetical protein
MFKRYLVTWEPYREILESLGGRVKKQDKE